MPEAGFRVRRPASASSALDGHTGLAFELGTAYRSGLPGFTVRSRTSAHQARFTLTLSLTLTLILTLTLTLTLTRRASA